MSELATADFRVDDPLALDPQTMRAMGHQLIASLVDTMCDSSTPALRRAAPDEMTARVDPTAPSRGRDFCDVFAHLRDAVFPYMSRLDHPGYFAFIPASGTWPGALGDLIASALNIYAGSWMEAAGPSQIELVVLDGFKQWIGYPQTAAGVLVSGGSAANITALACTREALLGAMTDLAVIYVADRAIRRSPARRACWACVQTKFGCSRPTRTSGCASMRSQRPSTQMRTRGGSRYWSRRPRVPRTRGRSIRWLRSPRCAASAPSYLQDAAVERGEVNFCDLGMQLSRGCRALKIWVSIQCFGLDAFRLAVDRCLDLAEHAGLHVDRSPELELMSPARLGIICFRRRGSDGDTEDGVAALNAALVSEFEATGEGLVSSTRLRGRYAIRLCVMNHTSTASDVDRVLDWFAEAPLSGPREPIAVRTPIRRADVHGGWPDESQISPEEIAALDWGAGYGHARSATVLASGELRLLALSLSHLNRLIATAPSVARQVHHAIRARV